MKFPMQHDHGANKTMIKVGKRWRKKQKRWRINEEMKGMFKFVIVLVYFIDSTLTSELTVIIHEFWDLVHLKLC